MRRVVLALALAAALVDCNAILGNDPKILDERGDASVVPPDGGGGVDAGSDAAPCAADLTLDPHNCGACGHDCLGGACTASACQPFVLATNQKTPSNLVVDQGTAYWTDGDGAVWSCGVRGCNQTPKSVMRVDAGNPFLSGLDVQGSMVYALGYYTAAIHACPTSGCAAPTTIAQNLDYPYDVRVDATNAYFLSANSGYLGKCPLPSCLAGATRMTPGGPPAWFGLVMDDQYLYWYAGPNNDFSKAMLYRAPKTQVDAGPELLLANRPYPTSLAVRNGTLYVVETGGASADGGPPKNGRVYKVALAAGLAQFTLASNQISPKGIAVDDTDAYWTSQSSGAILRCAIAGCNEAPSVVVTGQNQPASPVVTTDALYWTEYLGGTVKGLAK
jgi:hypothetical protein